MNVCEAILARRSVRQFTDEPVSKEQLMTLCRMGAAAPSACNKQPWVFYVVNTPEGMDGLRTVVKYGQFNAKAAIIVCGDRRCFLPGEAEAFWQQDVSAAAENILLAAVDMGLGGCWCGCYPQAAEVEKMRKHFNMPDHIVPLGSLHLGHPASVPEPRTQLRDDQVIFTD